MRLFAQKYPDEICGLILLDSTPEEIFEKLPTEYIKKTNSEAKMLRIASYLAPFGLTRIMKMPIGRTNLTPEEQKISNQLGYLTKSYETAYREIASIRKSMKQVKETMNLPYSFPVYIVCRDTFYQNGLGREKEEEVQCAWAELQQDLMKLSDESLYVIAKDSRHFIQLDRPDLVMNLAKELLETIKEKKS